jgi:hypothetical protein
MNGNGLLSSPHRTRRPGSRAGPAHTLVTHTTGVALPPAEVLARLKQFFAERVPQAAAFVETEGPEFVVLRGQGGEEIAVRAWSDAAGKTQVRASTLFFDQALDRFFSTLPLERGVELA